MRVIRQGIRGQIAEHKGFRALVIDRVPESEEPVVWLSYALVTMGKEEHILPALLLDDWGNEIKSLDLYSWLRENGERFPRAEIFGVDPAGEEVQLFVRVLELLASYPVYLDYEGSEGPERVHAFVLPDREVDEPVSIAPPDGVQLPMQDARVSWWRADPARLETLEALQSAGQPKGDW